LDLLQACILFGWDIPLAIAGGLLASRLSTEAPVPMFSASLLHFFIANFVAAIYYGASRKLRFLIEHPLVCGLFYGNGRGVGNESHRFAALRSPRPRPVHSQGSASSYIVHMIVIGLPVAFSVRRFAK